LRILKKKLVHGEAHRLNPNYAAAFYYRGAAYERKGQPDRAIEDYDQAIRLNPNYAEAFLNRGAVCNRKGQPDRAIEDLDQAIRNGAVHILDYKPDERRERAPSGAVQ
jgi:tetratricopeptide (TPR) repeat protein